MDEGGGNGARFRKIPVYFPIKHQEHPQPLSDRLNAPHANMPSAMARSLAAGPFPLTSRTPPRAFAISSRHET